MIILNYNLCHYRYRECLSRQNISFFREKFKAVDDAERHFDIKYFDDEFPLVVNTSNSTPKTGQACPMSANLSPIFEHSPTTEKVVAADTNGHAMKPIIILFGQLSSMQQENYSPDCYVNIWEL